MNTLAIIICMIVHYVLCNLYSRTLEHACYGLWESSVSVRESQYQPINVSIMIVAMCILTQMNDLVLRSLGYLQILTRLIIVRVCKHLEAYAGRRDLLKQCTIILHIA